MFEFGGACARTAAITVICYHGISREVAALMDAVVVFLCAAFALSLSAAATSPSLIGHSEIPKFGEPISNVTIPVGREAVLACVVEDLSSFKVAWLRVDTQTILTIHNHVITKNHRIAVTHSDHRIWYLHIRDVKQTDRGWYMCQINTDPMKSQVGFLEVVVPPDILDYPTSTDMVVREGSNVTLRCAASGLPTPNITWRRETGDKISLGSGHEVSSMEGSVFEITRVNRLHMGAYLCIASNGVPPTVSKRIMLIVHFPPMIWIQNQLVGAYEGQQVTLECHSEAYPKSINYWTRDITGDIIAYGKKYEPVLLDNAYKVHMKLTIRSVGISDFGVYKCVSKNSLGETDGSIKLYRVAPPTTTTTTMISTTVQTTETHFEVVYSGKRQDDHQAEGRDTDNDIMLMAEEISHSSEVESRNAELNNDFQSNTFGWPQFSESAKTSGQHSIMNNSERWHIFVSTLFFKALVLNSIH